MPQPYSIAVFWKVFKDLKKNKAQKSHKESEKIAFIFARFCQGAENKAFSVLLCL